MFPAHDHGGTERLGDPLEREGRPSFLRHLRGGGGGKKGVTSGSGADTRVTFRAANASLDDPVRGAARNDRGGADSGSDTADPTGRS